MGASSPVAVFAALCAFVLGQIAFGFHAKSAEPHDVSACVACHLGDRLDDGAPAPTLAVTAPVASLTQTPAAIQNELTGVSTFRVGARAPPTA